MWPYYGLPVLQRLISLGIVLHHLRLMSAGATDITQAAQVKKDLSQEKGFIGCGLIP